MDALLRKEKVLFAREIEEYYSLAKDEVDDFVNKQWPEGQDHMEKKSILGERYYKVQ